MSVQDTASTAAHDAAQRRAAARALLQFPMLTTRFHADDLKAVRHHGPALKNMFATMLGYPLVIEASFARLIKAPLSAHVPARAALRSSGGPFTPRTYSYLALVCAGLLAPGTGEQVLLSSVVEQLRSDAALVGVLVEDTLADRRHFVAVIDLLVSWGVVEETAGSVAAWGDRREEALLTVNRNLLPHLLARPLHAMTSPSQLVDAVPEGAEQPRRTLRRKLAENPVVSREDLTDAERDVLSRERTDLSRMLEENFGLNLEVRAEGALAFDPDNEVTDVPFPGNGTVRQAALLLLDALIDVHRPTPGATSTVAGRAVPGLTCTWVEVDQALDELVERHNKAWSMQYVADPAHLRDDIVELLSGVGLVAATAEAFVVHPAAARFRPNPQYSPTTTRARARMDSDVLNADSPGTWDLFDAEQP